MSGRRVHAGEGPVGEKWPETRSDGPFPISLVLGVIVRWAGRCLHLRGQMLLLWRVSYKLVQVNMVQDPLPNSSTGTDERYECMPSVVDTGEYNDEQV